jgi:hypothetical protein
MMAPAATEGASSAESGRKLMMQAATNDDVGNIGSRLQRMIAQAARDRVCDHRRGGIHFALPIFTLNNRNVGPMSSAGVLDGNAV